MLRHIVLLQWLASATPNDQSAAVDELRALPGHIREIRAYRVEADAHLAPGNFDLAIVADFDDVDGYIAYRDHPAHAAVIARRIKPILAARAALQHQLD